MPNPMLFDFGENDSGVMLIFISVVLFVCIGGWIKDTYDRNKRAKRNAAERQRQVAVRAWRADMMRANNWPAVNWSIEQEREYFCASCRQTHRVGDSKMVVIDNYRLCSTCYERWMKSFSKAS